MLAVYSSDDDVASNKKTLTAIGQRRQRVSLLATFVLLLIYFSFVIVVANFKSVLSTQIIPGLSVAIAVGVAVIVVTMLITFSYVLWINFVHDVAMRDFEQKGY